MPSRLGIWIKTLRLLRISKHRRRWILDDLIGCWIQTKKLIRHWDARRIHGIERTGSCNQLGGNNGPVLAGQCRLHRARIARIRHTIEIGRAIGPFGKIIEGGGKAWIAVGNGFRFGPAARPIAEQTGHGDPAHRNAGQGRDIGIRHSRIRPGSDLHHSHLRLHDERGDGPGRGGGVGRSLSKDTWVITGETGHVAGGPLPLSREQLGIANLVLNPCGGNWRPRPWWFLLKLFKRANSPMVLMLRSVFAAWRTKVFHAAQRNIH